MTATEFVSLTVNFVVTADDDGLSAEDLRYVRDRREQAIWYAFGQKDARKVPINAFAFGMFAANEARQYRRGETTFLASIQDQFQRAFNVS